MSLKTLLSDPEYKKLSLAQQREAVVQLEPEASSLTPDQYNQFISGVSDQSADAFPDATAAANTPIIPIRKIGGKILDAATKLTGSGEDRGIIKTNLPRTYGGLKAIAKKAEGLTTPVNTTLMIGMGAASPEIAAVAAGTFAVKSLVDLFQSVPEKYRQYKEALASGDLEKQSEIVNDAGLDVGMTALIGKQFAKEAPNLPELKLPSSPLRSPNAAAEGIAKTAKTLGDESLTPEAAGKEAKAIYDKRVTAPLAELTKTPIASAPPVAKTPAEIFEPEYNKVSSEINPESVTLQKAGETIGSAYKKKVGNLLSKEKAEWDNLSSKHFDEPATLDNTKNFIESAMTEQDQGISALDRLRPEARDNALRTANPEETARGMLQFGENSSKPVNPLLAESPSGGTTPEIQGAQLQRGYGALRKLYEISQEPTTFGRVKTLRSQLGGMIDWNVRGDELNHQLKGAYKSLTTDMADSAKTGGFQDSVDAAVNSSKDFFRYTEKPSSQIINKNKYASDLTNKLIKTNSPERVNELFAEHDLSEADKSVVRRAVLDEIRRQSGNDPKKFSNMLDKYSPETKQELWGSKAPLVDSLKNTVDVLKEQIKQSKQKPNAPIAYGAKDILSKGGFELDKIMKNSPASELVKNIVKDGTPELARTVSGAVGPEGMKLLRREAINQVVRGSETKLTGETNLANMHREFQKMSPEFIKEYFGDDADLVLALKYSSEFMVNRQTAFRQQSAGLPFMLRQKALWGNLIQKYRLSPQLTTLLGKQYGSSISGKIVPK